MFCKFSMFHLLLLSWSFTYVDKHTCSKWLLLQIYTSGFAHEVLLIGSLYMITILFSVNGIVTAESCPHCMYLKPKLFWLHSSLAEIYRAVLDIN
jgi:thiol-disulfide isomerase/thioredoxin